MKCVHCGFVISHISEDRICPHCGKSLSAMWQYEERAWDSSQESRGVEGASTIALQIMPRIRLPVRQVDQPIGSPVTQRRPWAMMPRVVEKEITAADVIRYFKAKRTRILIGLGVLQVALFALLAWWVYQRSLWHIDAAITRQFQSHEAIWVRDTMFAVSMLGNIPHLLEGLVALTAIILWFAHRRLAALLMVFVYEVSVRIYPLIKLVVNRPRPTQARQVQVLSPAHGTSFPSGHVVTYAAYWGLLFLLVIFVLPGKWSKTWWWRVPVLIVSAAFIILIGPSRIYVGDHWMTDVLGGYLFEGFLLCFAFLHYFKLVEVSPKLKAVAVQRVKWLNKVPFLR
jgi:membrane-associated phospholipid phosphatase